MQTVNENSILQNQLLLNIVKYTLHLALNFRPDFQGKNQHLNTKNRNKCDTNTICFGFKLKHL